MPDSISTIPDAMDIEEYAFQQYGIAAALFDTEVQREQLMCKIFHAYSGAQVKSHNCLGCNFNDQTTQLQQYLDVIGKQRIFSLSHSAALYYFLLNGIWERIRDVFLIISLPESYQARHFQSFGTARRWANFFKHPNEFGWLVHHPTYTLVGSNHCASVLAAKSVFIDEDFVKKYYSAERQKGLAKEFKGKERDVVVVLPDIVTQTKNITECLKKFVEIVTKNPVYFEILNDKATIVDYFDSLVPAVSNNAQVPITAISPGQALPIAQTETTFTSAQN